MTTLNHTTPRKRHPKVKLSCAACGKPVFIHHAHVGRSKYVFCSKECARTPIVPITCKQCGTEFLAVAQFAGQASWCSRECRNAYLRETEAHKHTKQVTKVCERCGAEYQVRPSVARVQRFCSRECFGVASPTIPRQRQPRPTTVCLYCGVVFETFPSRLKNGRRKYCCKEHFHLGNLARLAKNPRTGIEIAMAKALTEQGIEFQEQVPMFGKFLVDFLLPHLRIVIQCDGIYWHDRPSARARDKGQDRYFAKCGYTVLRFTDKAIEADMDGCIAAIHAAAWNATFSA